MAADSEITALVRRLGCLREVATLTGFVLAVEIGDWHRFTGRSIGSFVGLVLSELSSGASRSQGPITKAGNTHARRLLGEAAWHHRKRYVVGKTLRDRWAVGTGRRPRPRRPRQPPSAPPVGRLRPTQRTQLTADVAIARELAGWCWSLAVMD